MHACPPHTLQVGKRESVVAPFLRHAPPEGRTPDAVEALRNAWREACEIKQWLVDLGYGGKKRKRVCAGPA